MTTAGAGPEHRDTTIDGRRLPARWLVLSGGAGVIVLALIARRFQPENNDAVQFFVGAVSLWRAGSPYAISAAQLGLSHPQWTYCYPPALAYLLLPLAWTSLAAASWIWFVVNLFATAVFAWELAVLAADRGRARLAVLLGALLVLFPPHAQGLAVGQIHAVLAALLGAAALALVRDRDLCAGLLLGIASAIKLFPALLAVGSLVIRRWRTALTALAVMVAAGLLLGKQHWTFASEYVLAGFYPTSAFFNVSLHGLVSRLFQPGAYALAVADAPRAALAMKTALSLGALSLLIVALRRQLRWQGRWAAFIPAMLLLQPISGIYHLNLLLLVLVLLGPTALWRRQRVALVACVVLCVLPVEYGSGPVGFGASLYRLIHTRWGLLLGVPQLYGVVASLVMAARGEKLAARARA